MKSSSVPILWNVWFFSLKLLFFLLFLMCLNSLINLILYNFNIILVRLILILWFEASLLLLEYNITFNNGSSSILRRLNYLILIVLAWDLYYLMNLGFFFWFFKILVVFYLNIILWVITIFLEFLYFLIILQRPLLFLFSLFYI